MARSPDYAKEHEDYRKYLEKYLADRWGPYNARVTVAITGKVRKSKRRVTVFYAIAIDSDLALPSPLEGVSMMDKKGDAFMFVQHGNSVYTNSYSQLATARYTGSDPPLEPPG